MDAARFDLLGASFYTRGCRCVQLKAWKLGGGSSTVEQLAHNRKEVGSTPTRPTPRAPRSIGEQSELGECVELHRADYELAMPS